MCEAAGDDAGCGEDTAPARRRRAPGHSHPRPCVKCGQGSASLVIRLGDAFCRGCFREYFVHKFRAMLGKNRVIFPGEKVLLALSGGAASSAMLRQVQEGLSRETAKRLRFVPGLIYVDEGAVRGQSPAQREQSLALMETLLQATGFPYHLAHLEQALELPASILRPGPEGSGKPGPSYKEAVEGFIQQQRQEGDGDGGTSPPSLGTQAGDLAAPRLPAAAHTQELLRLFEAVETPTAREELLQMLRTHLILQTARTRGYAKVMTGESCTRVAIKLLTNLALGRGAFLAVDTGFVDNRHGDVMVVRPMREYMAKEIAFYNHFFHVPTVIAPPLPTKRREKPSIHRLMENFLLGLQEDFPSTISTVYRTGEKLSPAPAKASSESQRCLLCLCALDIAGEEELALEPTLITEEPELVGNGCCQDTPAAGAESKAAFIPLLCYGCRLTFKELGPLATLPPYVRAEAQRRIHGAQMKEQSQEVRLEDEEPGES
ncbi:cytoplasmic tRNA 2-thiolation protein 2 isoform X1 [Mycteria americana]|uniref:cytoplasmic tRNA 2-thiolation protein 2 isoform X1 n=1 Tax=Mycteria americana TaxID=33587 RepID=UPI003F58BDDB